MGKGRRSAVQRFLDAVDEWEKVIRLADLGFVLIHRLVLALIRGPRSAEAHLERVRQGPSPRGIRLDLPSSPSSYRANQLAKIRSSDSAPIRNFVYLPSHNTPHLGKRTIAGIRTCAGGERSG